MTTIDIAPTITVDGKEVKPHDARRVGRTIRQLHTFKPTKPFIVKARGDDGVGSLGLYLELVARRDVKGADGVTISNRPVRHTRYFVYGRTVYAASRGRDATKATWRQRSYDSVADALNVVEAAINREDVQQFGRAILVELTADDISTIEAGGNPGARFRGQYRNEKDFGKFDFDEYDAKNCPRDKVSPSVRKIICE